MIHSILFVCFANICRSPMAESIFRRAIEDRNLTSQWIVDSCSLSNYFTGDRPDDRALTVLRNHGLDSDHISRQLTDDDFEKFDYIFGMDEYIVASLNAQKRRINRETKSTIQMLGNYYPSRVQRIQDPYFSDENDLSSYEDCYRICSKSIDAFLDQMMIQNNW